VVEQLTALPRSYTPRRCARLWPRPRQCVQSVARTSMQPRSPRAPAGTSRSLAATTTGLEMGWQTRVNHGSSMARRWLPGELARCTTVIVTPTRARARTRVRARAPTPGSPNMACAARFRGVPLRFALRRRHSTALENPRRRQQRGDGVAAGLPSVEVTGSSWRPRRVGISPSLIDEPRQRQRSTGRGASGRR
jgi:hypothetical protein